eukprot:TRINITY_DN1003_c0_g1_i1.p1 TRINITY_DN1003_c0_g1~~TRINITY_DN1003_c0_g1_i1.p1  ORF type:complete len:250 (-),score=-13.67 TRINITY_DN1003_c0_g1_i1:334-1083(-)
MGVSNSFADSQTSEIFSARLQLCSRVYFISNQMGQVLPPFRQANNQSDGGNYKNTFNKVLWKKKSTNRYKFQECRIQILLTNIRCIQEIQYLVNRIIQSSFVIVQFCCKGFVCFDVLQLIFSINSKFTKTKFKKKRTQNNKFEYLFTLIIYVTKPPSFFYFRKINYIIMMQQIIRFQQQKISVISVNNTEQSPNFRFTIRNFHLKEIYNLQFYFQTINILSTNQLQLPKLQFCGINLRKKYIRIFLIIY